MNCIMRYLNIKMEIFVEIIDLQTGSSLKLYRM